MRAGRQQAALERVEAQAPRENAVPAVLRGALLEDRRIGQAQAQGKIIRAGISVRAKLTRQPGSGGSHVSARVVDPAASAQPTLHALCSVPSRRPRTAEGAISLMKTTPTAHSAPKPKPCTSLAHSNWS
jgi:hypothetical protein